MDKKYQKKKSVSSSAGLLRSLMLVFVSFFSGYWIASFVDIKGLNTWLSSWGPIHSQLVPVPQFAELHKTVKPKLEFYTLLTTNHNKILPNTTPVPASIVVKTNLPMTPSNPMAIKEPSTPLSHPIAPVVRAKPTTLVKTQTQPFLQKENASQALRGYFIQVAALRNRQDAERMKASLSLKGLDVNISTIETKGFIWYRVMVGSYASRAQAEQVQMILARRDHVNGMIRLGT